MKHKRIILSLTLLLSVLGVHAQEWRCFLEIFAGIEPGKSTITLKSDRIDNVWNPLSFGLNYTMGVKVWDQLYAGVGIGGYTSYVSYDYEDISDYGHCFPSLYFPVFANVRWIPNTAKTINPYADIKIGYQMGTELEDNNFWGSGRNYDCYMEHKNGVFLQPGFGLRLGRDSAFNIGVAYNVFMNRDYIASDGNTIVERISKNHGSFMLTFGADF